MNDHQKGQDNAQEHQDQAKAEKEAWRVHGLFLMRFALSGVPNAFGGRSRSAGIMKSNCGIQTRASSTGLGLLSTFRSARRVFIQPTFHKMFELGFKIGRFFYVT